MTIEQFQTTLHQALFRPFTIRMADGRSFDIRHPDFVARSESGRTIVVFHGGGENYSVLDLLLMSELEVQPSNGQSV